MPVVKSEEIRQHKKDDADKLRFPKSLSSTVCDSKSNIRIVDKPDSHMPEFVHK